MNKPMYFRLKVNFPVNMFVFKNCDVFWLTDSNYPRQKTIIRGTYMYFNMIHYCFKGKVNML